MGSAMSHSRGCSANLLKGFRRQAKAHGIIATYLTLTGTVDNQVRARMRATRVPDLVKGAFERASMDGMVCGDFLSGCCKAGCQRADRVEESRRVGE